ncbi:MAG: hypothetical protein R6W76_08360, partial [Caldilinea sp.]
MSTTAIQHAIHQLFAGRSLTTDEADAAMAQIMEGEASPAQVGAFLAALRMKGETVDEITGCARAMKRSAVQVHPAIGNAMLVDVVGTGGDSIGTFNISTTAAFVGSMLRKGDRHRTSMLRKGDRHRASMLRS